MLAALEGEGGAPEAPRAKRRRQMDVDPTPPSVWTRPPQWLYLPHLGCVGGELVSYDNVIEGEGDVRGSASGVDGAPTTQGAARDDGEAIARGSQPVGGARGADHANVGALSRRDEAHGGGALHGEGGTGFEDGEPIRGRGLAPGRGSLRERRIDGGVTDERDGDAEVIRGHTAVPGSEDTALGRAAAAAPARVRRTAEEVREESHRREVARRGLTRYFSDIAETAARRAAAASAAGEHITRESAQERLAALRRRILERTEAAGTCSRGHAGRQAGTIGVEASMAAADTASSGNGEMHLLHVENRMGAAGVGPTEEETRCAVAGLVVAAPTSNEDGKMHSWHGATRVQLATALGKESRQAGRGTLEAVDAHGGGGAGQPAARDPTLAAARGPAAVSAASQVGCGGANSSGTSLADGGGARGGGDLAGEVGGGPHRAGGPGAAAAATMDAARRNAWHGHDLASGLGA